MKIKKIKIMKDIFERFKDKGCKVAIKFYKDGKEYLKLFNYVESVEVDEQKHLVVVFNNGLGAVTFKFNYLSSDDHKITNLRIYELGSDDEKTKHWPLKDKIVLIT